MKGEGGRHRRQNMNVYVRTGCTSQEVNLLEGANLTIL